MQVKMKGNYTQPVVAAAPGTGKVPVIPVTPVVKPVPGMAEKPVQPKTPVVAETMGSGTNTPAVAAQQESTIPQSRAPEKSYDYGQLVQYQQEEAAADRAERAAGGNFIRVGSGYTNIPNERTIKLSQPFDGMGYYDPGVKVYAGQPGAEQYFDANGNWKAPHGMEPQPIEDGAGAGGPSAGGVWSGSGVGMNGMLDQWKQAADAQVAGQIDYAVSQGVAELERALQDAQPAFREQAEAVARAEAQGLDNSALYAELRGDRGGIGQSQYNEIQAAAAQNRLAVQQAQTKLSTDTARQIADLRARGEFEKADKLLSITQNYLSQLMALERWSAEFGLSQQQFQASLQQWQKEYDLAREKFGFDVGKTEKAQQLEMAYALLEQGIALTPEQLKVLGLSEEQAAEWLLGTQLEQAAGDGREMTYEQARKLLDSGVYSEKAAMIYEAYAGVPYDFTGHPGILKNYLSNPAVKTAKVNIDRGTWRGEVLLGEMEGAVERKLITEEEAIALLRYAGLA